MQIVALGVYSKDGRRRDVHFRRGVLNILTGKSKTGKSAVLDIAEYCLGRNTVTIPTGVISNSASWYYILVEFGNERVLIGRPNPETASTNRAMVRSGGPALEAPPFGDLVVNADTDVIRDVLSERLGIEAFTVSQEPGSLRASFDVSVRQALFFNFQSQGEIASRDNLFHRQSEGDIKGTIRDTLPYFLGAATPEQAALRRQLVAARRALQRTESYIRASEADFEQQDARLTHILDSAAQLGVFGGSAAVGAPRGRVRELLEQILNAELDEMPDAGSLARRRQDLVDAGSALRAKVREIDDQVALLRSLQRDVDESDREAGYQRDRLRAIELMLPKGSPRQSGDISSCPLCDQALGAPDESVEELREVLEDLAERLAGAPSAVARRQATITRLLGSREPLIDELRGNSVELDALAEQEAAIAEGLSRRERLAFLKGRVSQELERGVDAAGDVSRLRSDERRLRGQLARLEEMYERDDPATGTRAALDSISELMTDYARVLGLEGAEDYVRLDAVELTVAVQSAGGRVPLARMGSAENWVGYHLVAHLALHHWFVSQDRPVPRFLMLDQPTQAFFPEEVVDAADDENADWEAVRRQFRLMRDVVAALDGRLQVIVCDHANLADGWFQESVVDNWRNGVALIPADWLGGDEG